MDFMAIDLSKTLPYKDFGKGFYLTSFLEQAKRMALRKILFLYADRYKQPSKKNCTMTKQQIRTYLIDNALNKIVKYVMEDNGCDMLMAMKEVYSSPVMNWLENSEDDLYTQSPAYIYELKKQTSK